MNHKSNAPAPDVRGHVVQIDPNASVQPDLRGALGFIIELKTWGAIIGVPLPGQGYAPVRVPEDHYRPIGAAPWVPSWCV